MSAAECRHTGEILTIGPHGKCRDCGARGPFHESAYVGHCYVNQRAVYTATTRPDRIVPPAEPPMSNRTGTP